MANVKVRALRSFFHGATLTHRKHKDVFMVSEDHVIPLRGYVEVLGEDDETPAADAAPGSVKDDNGESVVVTDAPEKKTVKHKEKNEKAGPGADKK